MHAISYTSSAVHLPTTEELEALLVDARDFNASVAVTGALLLWDQSFFQYFEGPQKGVDEVYERIRKSRQHRDIIQLLHEPIQVRHFAQWHMGFAEAPQSVMLALAHSRWKDRADALRPSGPAQPSGVAILLQFWRHSRRLR
jgi:hypothetical protein